MPTLVLDPQPAAFERLLEERRRVGANRRDEVWQGVLHMIPPPSVEHERLAHRLHVLLDAHADTAGFVVARTVGIGTQNNHCVPDLALLRPDYEPQWNETAALVVEVVSPGDKTWEKLGFYAAHQVNELVIVEPGKRTVHWLKLAEGEYQPVERSGLIDLGPAELDQRIDWP